jgi:hypothetical protein
MSKATTYHAVCAVLLGAGLSSGCGTTVRESAAEVEVMRVEGAVPDTVRLPRAELERARQTASALGQDLAGLVFSTLEREGAEAAVRVCSDVAQERTAAHGTGELYVRRISDRLRNPLNEPDATERREFERMQELAAQGDLPSEIVRVVDHGSERSLHLLRPIRIQQPCLACHGEPEAIAPEVRRILAERYPEDRAVGYTAGQLRGAISVRVPVREGERRPGS